VVAERKPQYPPPSPFSSPLFFSFYNGGVEFAILKKSEQKSFLETAWWFKML
jgi:hypothetical protein